MHPDPHEAGRRVAAHLEALFAIHRENLRAMHNACLTVHRQRELMLTAWQQAARASRRVG